MGIKNLNRYLRNKCKNSITCINIKELSGKKIAVDISIYLYKYETEGLLLENMYLMLSIFIYNNITPIFIFDGKPPPEKYSLLKKRKENKKEALLEYGKLKNQLEDNINDDAKQELIYNMDLLKRQFVSITPEKINIVKKLIISYGATYYDAIGEADELCAMLVNNKMAWCCMSEDMDMFVYGCKRVLRYFSLMNQTVVLYCMKGILQELNMKENEFKEICILSGTDYNINTIDNMDLFTVLEIFNDFKNNNENNDNETFYNWFIKNTKYNLNLELLDKITNMFDLSSEYNTKKLDVFKKIKIINGNICQLQIQSIMKDDGFIFVNDN
jgi:flap endonuclease-1